MVDIVVKKLTPEEYGDLITLKKKKGYDSWKELVIAEVLEEEKEND